MFFMLPCTLCEAGATILVVPLVSLLGDLHQVQEIDIEHWSLDARGQTD